MRDTPATARLTVLIILTTAVSMWLVSTGSQGPLAGIAAWLLVATLSVLLTWVSIRTRWYIRGLVQPSRPEDEHETAAPSKPREGRTWPTRLETTRFTRFFRRQHGRREACG